MTNLLRITGVDLTQIDGINAMTAQTLISEVGLDMSRWKTEAHFASWLGLCPDNRISGDKVLEPRNAACSQPGCHGAAHSSHHFIEESNLSGRTIPAVANQIGRP